MARRSLRRDDEGASEVIGFVLSFALSAIFLMISMNAFYAARANSDGIVTAAELKTIADRVASRVVEAGLVAQEFPNATLNLTMDIPVTLNEHLYYVTASNTGITAVSTEMDLAATATTFRLDAIDGIRIDGTVHSSSERLVITYSLQDGGATKSIHIHEES